MIFSLREKTATAGLAEPRWRRPLSRREEGGGGNWRETGLVAEMRVWAQECEVLVNLEIWRCFLSSSLFLLFIIFFNVESRLPEAT